MAEDELFDVEEIAQENEDNPDSDPLDTKQRIMVQKYAENLISGMKGPKLDAYAYAYFDGSTTSDLGDSYHGAKVSMVAAWRKIERKLGFQKLSHELGLDNFSLLTKLSKLMETERPMMKKNAAGSQDEVWYPDGQVQLRATETIIRLANQLSIDSSSKDTKTLNITFGKVESWDNVEVHVPKKEEDLV